MRPLNVITLIILGSSFAIMVSLTAVIILVLILGDEYPRLQTEYPQLKESLIIFTGMTAISVLSFFALLHEHRGRYFVQAAMWASIFGIGWYYWV